MLEKNRKNKAVKVNEEEKLAKSDGDKPVISDDEKPVNSDEEW